MAKTIFMTGAGSGLAKGAALGLAKKGHRVIATVEIAPQVTSLKEAARTEGVELEVFQLDIKSAQDRAQIEHYDFDIFVPNAAINQGGPIGEIPMSNIREIFEVNVFSTLETAQIAAKKLVDKGKGKIIFVSSSAGVLAAPYSGPYAASKHALEAIIKTMQKELEQFNVQVASINPGPFATGFNDRAVESQWKWYDEKTNYTPKEDLLKVEQGLANQFDPEDMIAKMVEVIPKESHKFRTAYPPEIEKQMKEEETNNWEKDV